LNRDKAGLLTCRIKDESPIESGDLFDSDVLGQAIVNDLGAALKQFRENSFDFTSDNTSNI
jgi:hypothetical protein